jgi:hypothetical protein
MTDERTIQQALRRWAVNHKYVLVNAFVFAWESDFFSVTKSGTIYEVEIKISRSDFKKDFEKVKHRLFEASASGQKFKVIPSGLRDYGSHLFDIMTKKMDLERWYVGRRFDKDFINDDSFGYWMRRERFINLRDSYSPIYAPATGIQIVELAKRLIPNRFYYACPEGLLTKEDVPKYAGLLHVTEHGVEMVKQAPFLHKTNLWSDKLLGILLDKFWYLSQNQRYHLVRNNIPFKDCYEETKTDKA